MGIFSFLGSLINPVTELVKGRQDIKKAQVKAKIRRIDRDEESDIALDNLAVQNSSYMDDLSFYMALAIVAGCFIPQAVPHIREGFIVLDTMPQWFQYAFGLMLASVWGWRKLAAPIIGMIMQKSILGKR